MHRNQQNLVLYKETCRKVIERADNRCECMIDSEGKVCTNNPKHRCLKYIPTDQATYTNFIHTETRSGKSDDWILSPENIIFGCACHHLEEHSSKSEGRPIQRCSYEEINYVPLLNNED